MLITICTIQNEISHFKTKINISDEIIHKIGNDDAMAFEELYRKTDKAIFGFALSILKNTHDAEDVMQDAYLQIRKYAHAYTSNGKPMAWILTITRNLCFAKLRHKSSQNVDIDEVVDLAIDSDLAVSVENKMMIEHLMQVLTDEERQIVILHAQTGMKHREIATILNLSLSTVLSKYKRAIAKLSKAAKI